MPKGAATRNRILDHAALLAAGRGLAGLTIGALAEDLDLSKSGLFAHFGSKERLQTETVAHVRERFARAVIAPVTRAPAGRPRLVTLFEKWTAWAEAPNNPLGCPFVAASTELDDQEGPVRDAFLTGHRQFLRQVTDWVREAIALGHLRRGLDADQFVFELHGLILSRHHRRRLLRDPDASRIARRAFDQLLQRSAP